MTVGRFSHRYVVEQMGNEGQMEYRGPEGRGTRSTRRKHQHKVFGSLGIQNKPFLGSTMIFTFASC